MNYHKKPPFNIFWLDDYPDEVIPIVEKLESHEFSVTIYKDPKKLKQDIKTKSVEFSIGIFDLQLDNSISDGIKETKYIRGIYSSQKKLVPAFGAVSRHRETYESMLRNNNPYLFEFDKSELLNGSFANFNNLLFRYSRIHELNKQALEYEKLHPVTIDGYNTAESKQTCYGFVEKIDDEIAILKFWDPMTYKNCFFRKFTIDFIFERNIRNEHQSVRLITFSQKKNGPVSVQIEPIGKVDLNIRKPLNPNFNYDIFK